MKTSALLSAFTIVAFAAWVLGSAAQAQNMPEFGGSGSGGWKCHAAMSIKAPLAGGKIKTETKNGTPLQYALDWCLNMCKSTAGCIAIAYSDKGDSVFECTLYSAVAGTNKLPAPAANSGDFAAACVKLSAFPVMPYTPKKIDPQQEPVLPGGPPKYEQDRYRPEPPPGSTPGVRRP